MNTPPLYRTDYRSADGKLVKVKTTNLFVWAAVDTETGHKEGATSFATAAA
jgi:hypothetical protein